MGLHQREARIPVVRVLGDRDGLAVRPESACSGVWLAEVPGGGAVGQEQLAGVGAAGGDSRDLVFARRHDDEHVALIAVLDQARQVGPPIGVTRLELDRAVGMDECLHMRQRRHGRALEQQPAMSQSAAGRQV